MSDAAVIDLDTTINTQKCKLSCFRKRELYRHSLIPAGKSQNSCDAEPSCQEQLTALKAQRRKLAMGEQLKTVFIGSKQITFESNMKTQKEMLEELIYELECECGCYAQKKRVSGGCLSANGCCGCGPRCGCGGCGTGRAIRGYL